MNIKPELLVDGYKIDHRRQYPAGTQIVFSNLTARKTRRQSCEKIVFFGLQYFIKEYLINQWNDNFFSQPVEKVLGRFALEAVDDQDVVTLQGNFERRTHMAPRMQVH